jgi:hypothetical protein
MPPNKRMKLTKLSAAPLLGRRCRLVPAPSRMHAGTASQLIRGVRWTRWSGSAPDGHVALVGQARRTGHICRSKLAYGGHIGLARTARPFPGRGGSTPCDEPSLRAEAEARQDWLDLQGVARRVVQVAGVARHASQVLNSLCLVG